MKTSSRVATQFVFLAIAAATAFHDVRAESARLSDSIRIQISAEPSTLDPARVIDQSGIGILRNMVEGLFVIDSAGALQNGLTDSYEVSKDRLTYRFHLKKDAKWSDGVGVKAADFVYAVRHIVDPKTASPDAASFFAIKGAEAAATKGANPEQVGISERAGDVVIELARKDPSLELELSLPAAAPLRQDVFEKNRGQWSPKSPTTGPYVISRYRPSSQIRLEPNAFHSPKALNNIVYDILPEEITALNLFEAGRVDIISTVTPTEMMRLDKLGLIQKRPSTTVFYFSFDVSKPPFNDLNYRQAVSSSIDRAGLAKILRGGFVAETSFLPEAVDGALPYRTPAFAKAVETVRNLKEKARVRLAYSNSASNQLIAEKVQEDLRLSLGLKVTLEPMELKTLLSRLSSDPPEMYLLGKSAMYNDPINHLTSFTNKPEANFSRYTNTEYENLVEQIKTEPVGQKRTAMSREANRILVERDAVAVPVLLKLQVFGVSKQAENFAVSPYQVIQLDRLTK